VVVGVRDARARRPSVRAAHFEDRLLEAAVFRDFGEAGHADPERALLPAARVTRFFFHVSGDVAAIHAGELPVRDARGDFEDVLARGVGGGGDRCAQCEQGDDAERGAEEVAHETPLERS
jgi:hypothetical protein